MQHGEVRIIGGRWRSRKLKFPAVAGLRPSPDSVRETLFNWLAPVIHGANCLDLFTGSGALGFEALSRGANHVVMVDASPEIIAYLRKQLVQFETENAKVLREHFPFNPTKSLATEKFNIVFLDPPFQRNLIKPCCEWLVQHDLLTNNAYIYIEAEAKLDVTPLVPNTWQLLRSKKAGDVGYHLFIKY